MTTFHIENFGCRATAADAAAIERQLLERGHTRSTAARDAGVVVLNTCTVTAAADSQAREAIRHIHRNNPSARILVTGCYAQRAPEELAALDSVTWVVGNSHQSEIARLVECSSEGAIPRVAPSQTPSRTLLQIGPTIGRQPLPTQITPDELLSLASAPAKILTGNIFEQSAVMVTPVLGGEADRTRPVLKIQDGCNHRCAYCVIPFVRGRSRSLPPAQVVEEIRRLVAAGYKEVVLSGIKLGSYGRDLLPRVEFNDLVRRILDETPLERLRLSSIEPMDVTQDLVELVAAGGRIARHFHIPLQSGCDRVLAAMHRWYRAAHYARRLELIRERLPAAALGADVIAGFPGESDDDHRTTLAFIERLPFTYLHVFSFSPRPGTTAAATSDHVPPQIVKQRARELRSLAVEKSAAFRASQVGSTLRVLTLRHRAEEDCRGGPPPAHNGREVTTAALGCGAGCAPSHDSAAWTKALSDNYLQVRIPGSRPANQFLDVRLAAEADSHLLGELVPA